MWTIRTARDSIAGVRVEVTSQTTEPTGTLRITTDCGDPSQELPSLDPGEMRLVTFPDPDECITEITVTEFADDVQIVNQAKKRLEET